jgi:hypothetical protein
MARVFRPDTSAGADDGLWSFSYIDWLGRVQTGVGTSSRMETKQLADRVQAEHHALRKHRRKALPDGGHEDEVDQDQTPSAGLMSEAEIASLELRVYSKATPEPSEADPESADGPPAPRIGERMVQDGLITEEDLDSSLKHQAAHGGRLVEILIGKKVITPQEFLRFMGKQPSTPYIDLEHCDIPESVIRLVPLHMAKQYEVIPIDRMGKMLCVAMVCPIDKVALHNLQGHTGLKVRSMLCSQTGFQNAFVRHYR